MLKILPTQDARILAALNREIQEMHAGIHPFIFKPYNRLAIEEAFGKMLSQKNCRAFIAMEKAEPLAYLLCFVQKKEENAFHYRDHFLYIDQIHVQKKHRGKGIGRSLMQKACELAKNEGLAHIQLDHWTKNPLARGFFNRIGFVYCKESMLMKI